MTEVQVPTERRYTPLARVFWITIAALAVATLALAVVGSLRVTGEAEPREIPTTVLERLLRDPAGEAYAFVTPNVDAMVDAAYAPAYAAIPAYATFHYSVLGEYAELTGAALGQMGERLHDRLFGGLDERLVAAGASLDGQYSAAYRAALMARVNAQFPPDAPMVLGPLTDAVVRDALARAAVTVPLASVAATVAGSGALKATTAVMVKKLAVKIAAKAAAKGAAKGGGAIAGAGGGALLCAWSGPGAVLCAAGGAVAAWVLADAVVVNLDEYFNREAFEAELRLLIDADKAEKKRALETALADKAREMEDFTLGELKK